RIGARGAPACRARATRCSDAFGSVRPVETVACPILFEWQGQARFVPRVEHGAADVRPFSLAWRHRPIPSWRRSRKPVRTHGLRDSEDPCNRSTRHTKAERTPLPPGSFRSVSFRMTLLLRSTK